MFPCATAAAPGPAQPDTAAGGFVFIRQLNTVNYCPTPQQEHNKLSSFFKEPKQIVCLSHSSLMHSYSFSAGTKGEYLTNIRQGLVASCLSYVPPPGLQNCRDLWQLGDIQMISSFLYIFNPWPELLIF